ncbi:MAG TPA: hypothetical protein VES19_02915 [Candidatus Limnocylindrales bacterium]|nr:hypothetical protein [Candidatus Limnocylindrales bacterium]
MFAMLAGAWPRVTADGIRLEELEAGAAAGRVPPAELEAAVDRAVAEAVAAQVEAGMGLVTDGDVRWADPARALLAALLDVDTGMDGMLVRAWTAAADLTESPVAARITGPWSLALLDVGGRGDATVVPGRAGELADTLAGELGALAAAGCPVVVVDEPAAVAIGEDAAARGGFTRAQRRLLRRTPDLHAMLAISGGSAAAAGAETIVNAPYASFLFDLLAGPDNWNLVRAAAPERGIVCAALAAGDGREAIDQSPQLVWAARYAASSGGRGLERVGLANASSLAGLSPVEARRALDALGRAAAFATLPPADAIAAGLDRRTFTSNPYG